VNSIIKQRQWLYLLTALVLLMQSFAIWHDASHAFHIASDQCQRFESISHTPSLDLVASILPQLTTQCSVTEPSVTITFALKRLRENHNIRGPPTFS
jgi:hypothetical protein